MNTAQLTKTADQDGQLIRAPASMPTAPARRLNRQTLGLGAVLVVSGVMLLSPAAQTPPSAVAVPLAVAWAHAQTGVTSATLPDGSAYQPELFLNAHTSIGTAPTPDGTSLRLLLRNATSIRLLRSLPLKDAPSFGYLTTAGDVLAWAERTNSRPLHLWTINLRDRRPARQVTSDVGDLVTTNSQYDLTMAGGRLYWAATDHQHVDTVQVRSVALTGGRVETRTEPGTWQLSTWPWLVNGQGTPRGATRLRNTTTHHDIRISRATGLATTSCSPTWCHIDIHAPDGSTHVDLQHPDGTHHETIPGDALRPAITDVAPLDKFEVLSKRGPNTDVTHTGPLLIYEIATRRTIQLSPDAGVVTYGHGVLWWSNGNQTTTIWHTLDLRTI
jgi:hypothetical protein